MLEKVVTNRWSWLTSVKESLEACVPLIVLGGDI